MSRGSATQLGNVLLERTSNERRHLGQSFVHLFGGLGDKRADVHAFAGTPLGHLIDRRSCSMHAVAVLIL